MVTRRGFLAAGAAAGIGLVGVRLLESPAYAGTTTLTTDDQLWVSQAAPAATNCTTWSSVNGSTTAGKRTVVSFNTSGVVPTGQQVTAATLRIYPKATYASGSVAVKAYARGAAGCNLTWNTLGLVGSQVGLSSGGFTKNVYKSIVVDPAAINTAGRTGFVLDGTAAVLLEFRSDGSGPNLNPSKLDLTWAPAPTTTAAPTTTTLAATTTTLEPTTTTLAPTTTTAEAGGIYHDSYEVL